MADGLKMRNGKYVCTCEYCGKEILRATLSVRHFCDMECKKAWKKQQDKDKHYLRDFSTYDSQIKLSKDAMDARIHGMSYGQWMARKAGH